MFQLLSTLFQREHIQFHILLINSCSNVGIGSEYVDVLNKPQASIDYNPKDKYVRP